MSNIITVENLTKRYETYKRGSSFKESVKTLFHREKVPVVAVDNISFEVKEGDIVGLLGPNGAGKSTTIKMLTGALYPTSGNLEVMGYTPTKHRRKYVQQIGAVFGQRSQLIWDIPPVDSFRMNKAIYGISNQDYDERVKLMSELFNVEEFITRPTRVLSLGERMKCEFIMAMLHQPKVVFLDEPTIGVDVIAKQRIREFILEMNQRGTTFILTTHDLQDVEQLARKVVIINHGQKVFDDTLPNLKVNLGAKKIVELVLKQPMEAINIPGVFITNRVSELNLTVSVDLSIITISEFISKLSSICEFTDISIKEMPMETIITEIYQAKKENQEELNEQRLA